jgi:hypothetical protein
MSEFPNSVSKFPNPDIDSLQTPNYPSTFASTKSQKGFAIIQVATNLRDLSFIPKKIKKEILFIFRRWV